MPHLCFSVPWKGETFPSMGTRTASPWGRYGERYTHFTMLRGMQANFAKKASTKPTIPGLRKFPPGRLMAVSDIIPFGQRPELHTLVLTC